MPRYSKKPKLLETEIVKEIRNRTLYPADIISNVLKTYADIAKETLPLGIECTFPGLGCFTFREKRPKEDVTIYSPRDKAYIEHTNLPGYKRISFRATPTWKKELKELSAVKPWEEKEKKENE